LRARARRKRKKKEKRRMASNPDPVAQRLLEKFQECCFMGAESEGQASAPRIREAAPPMLPPEALLPTPEPVVKESKSDSKDWRWMLALFASLSLGFFVYYGRGLNLLSAQARGLMRSFQGASPNRPPPTLPPEPSCPENETPKENVASHGPMVPSPNDCFFKLFV
jgi:hypothetical protein